MHCIEEHVGLFLRWVVTSILIPKKAYQHIFPPVRICQNLHCKNSQTNAQDLTLVELVTHKATLFTLRDGALPVYATSMYCRGNKNHSA